MKTKARSSPSNIKLTALLAAGLMFGAAQNALAAGTAAGTSITNTATLAYEVLGVPQTDKTAISTAFVVDAKINLTVANGATATVVPGATSQAASFTVTNNANTALDFNLAVNDLVAGDDFNPSACAAYAESGATAGYQSAQDIATFIDELAVDTAKTVYVVCSIPASATNGQSALVGLTATARGNFNATTGAYEAGAGAGAAIVESGADDPAKVDIVFADTTGTEAGDTARDAEHSDRNTFSVATAALSISKTASLLCDPLNGLTTPKNIPGAIIQWTITVSNAAGASAATLTSIADALNTTSLGLDYGAAAALTVPVDAATCVAAAVVPANMAFKVTVGSARVLGGSLAGSGSTSYFTYASDADGVEFATPNITATFATILPIDGATSHATAGLLNAGESVSVIFNTVVQ